MTAHLHCLIGLLGDWPLLRLDPVTSVCTHLGTKIFISRMCLCEGFYATPKTPVGFLRVPLMLAQKSASVSSKSLKYMMIKEVLCLEALVQLQSSKQMHGGLFFHYKKYFMY